MTYWIKRWKREWRKVMLLVLGVALLVVLYWTRVWTSIPSASAIFQCFYWVGCALITFAGCVLYFFRKRTDWDYGFRPYIKTYSRVIVQSSWPLLLIAGGCFVVVGAYLQGNGATASFANIASILGWFVGLLALVPSMWSLWNTIVIMNRQERRIDSYDSLLAVVCRDLEELTTDIECAADDEPAPLWIFAPSPAIGNLSASLKAFDRFDNQIRDPRTQFKITPRMLVLKEFSAWHETYIDARIELIRNALKSRTPIAVKKAQQQLSKHFAPEWFRVVVDTQANFDDLQAQVREKVNALNKALGSPSNTVVDPDDFVDHLLFLKRLAHTAADAYALRMLEHFSDKTDISLLQGAPNDFPPIVALLIGERVSLTWIAKTDLENPTENRLLGYTSDEADHRDILDALFDKYKADVSAGPPKAEGYSNGALPPIKSLLIADILKGGSGRQGEPMNDALTILDLTAALCLTHVSVLPGAARKWQMLNSVAYATLPMSVAALIKDDLDGKAGADLKISVNFIHVHGRRPPEEKLHYHTAAIIGIVTFGSGFVDHIIDGVATTTAVMTRDVVIIPRGALHTFHCKEGETVDYAVLEIGSDVDGQAHHYSDGGESH